MVESSPLFDSVAVRPQLESAAKPLGSFTDHLANERTFLAWTRTGLGIFALGCAVARFGGINEVKTTLKNTLNDKKPVISGLILIFCGITTIAYGIWRYYRINHEIIRKDLTTVSQIREPVIATLLLLLSMMIITLIFIIL